MADKRHKQKNRQTFGRYLGLPKSVTDCEDFRTLSGTATKVLLMIATQFNGVNNGDLAATFTLAKKWGIGSEETLSKALKILIAANLILRTRTGWFLNPGRKCALYAVTWLPINECKGKHDEPPTIKPPRAFSMDKIKTPLQKL